MQLNYQPVELAFGTSGRRGKVVDLTPLEVYINAFAELSFLQSLKPAQGGIRRGDEFYFALDLRPSSKALAQTIVTAIRDSGMKPINLGRIPTPALAYYALARGKGSIMVTGSHIPFDRNGYKVYTSIGELKKEQEKPINEKVSQIRRELYAVDDEKSLFDARGDFKSQPAELPTENDAAREAWIERYINFFQGASLAGKRILVYQHSAVGRDLLVELLQRLGAEVIPAGRSETFVPIDTENISAAQLAIIQELADQAGSIFAAVSVDGDSDRPLVLAVDASGKVQFFGGDLVGMVVAEYLDADSVVVPISCNDAIDRGNLAPLLAPKTRIGSPFVIAGMEAAQASGKQRVCGWEPNGGFLTGSDVERGGAKLKALLTRDAFLPILSVLFASVEKNVSPAALFADLPKRFSRAALLANFPRPVSRRIEERFAPGRSNELAKFFTGEMGFGAIVRVDYTDGVRTLFDNGDVAHVRPSGNADELRIYAVADTQARADQIVAMGVAEPNGILRQMERFVS